MKRSVRIFFLIFFSCLFMCFQSYSAGKYWKGNAVLLEKLDSLVANHQDIIDQKESTIEVLKIRLANAKNPERRLYLMRDIFAEYKKYDADSAMVYSEAIASLANELPSRKTILELEHKINLGDIYATQGRYERAQQLLQEIDYPTLPEDLKDDYLKALINLYSLKSMFISDTGGYDPSVLEIAVNYGDSLKAISDEDIWEEYLWLPLALPLNDENRQVKENAVEKLENIVNREFKPTFANAVNAYWLAKYYESIDDDIMALHYLIISSIYDAMLENRDITSIKELGEYLLLREDPERAYTYLTYALQQANAYHNRNMMVAMSMVLPDVLEEYRAEVSHRDHKIRGFIIALSILAFVLLVTVVVVIHAYWRTNKTRKELNFANSSLKHNIEAKEAAINNLKQAEDDLRQSREVERSMLTLTISIAAHYVNAIDAYRKRLLKLYKSNKMKDIETILDNDEYSKEKFAEFYKEFDNVILSIFPDIVEDFNRVAIESGKPEMAVSQDMTDLNTRLRIHALNKLGIDKSADQAKILNLSIRTIYNNRINKE